MNTILVIDDNSENRHSIIALISDLFSGFVIHTASSGPEGIEMAKTHHPDVILLDILLPGMDGFEVCRILKNDETLCEIPVVIVTALKEDKQNKLHAIEAGAEGFLTKPFDREEFVIYLKAMLKIKEVNDFKRSEKQRLEQMVSELTRDLLDDGSVKFVTESCTTYNDDHGNPVRSIGTVMDITGRSQTEEEKRQHHQMLDTILNTIPQSVFWKDIHGRYLGCNSQFAQAAGLASPDEIIGKTDFDLPWTREEAEAYRADDRHVMDHKSPRSHIIEPLQQADGSRLWIDTTKMPLFDKNGSVYGVLGVYDNITERKHAEAALRMSDERFKLIISISNTGAWEYHHDRDRLWCSPEYFTMLGRNPDDFITDGFTNLTKSWIDLLHPDDRDRASRHFADYLANGSEGMYDNHFRMKHRNGDWNWIWSRGQTLRDSDGKLTNRTLGTHINITELKRTEEELINAKERVESNETRLIEAQSVAKVGSWETDLLTLQVYWSEETYKIFELDSTIFTPDHNSFLKFVHPDDRIKVDQAFKNSFTREDYNNIEHRIITAQGKLKYTEERWRIIKDREGKPITAFGTCQDITERKNAEILVQKSKKELERAQELAKMGSWELDIETGIFTFTDSFFKIFHTTAEAMGGYQMTIEDYAKQFVHPDDASMVAAETRLAVESDDPYFTKYIEHRFLYIDGGTGFIGVRFFIVKDEFGNTIKTYGVNQDITEKKIAEVEIIKAKEKVEKSEEKFRKAILTIPDAITINRMEDGVYVSVNNAFYNIFQFSEREVIGKSSGDLHIWQHQEQRKEYILLLEKSAILENYEARFLTKTGKILDCLVSSSIILIDGIRHTINIIKDISHHKNIERELITAKDKAEESDRLKSAFLANMSHEIRTPMNGILGFADLLKEPGLTGAEQQKYIEIIERSGKRMLNIINDIVDISKIEAGLAEIHISESNINGQIEYITTFFKPEAENKGLKLSVGSMLNSDEATCSTDREKLYAILTNLVKNAIKYTQQGEIGLGCVHKGGILEFYVKDTGIGIPKDRQQAIFERFIQADIEDEMAYQGAGLGLSISKSFVEMLGGRIWVESELGKGSTFYFTLPYTVRAKREIVDPKEDFAKKEAGIRKLKILVAEDDEPSIKLLDTTLQRFSNEILNAGTGAEAVEIARSNPDIDLILIDIRMPVMGGYEAVKQIRKFNQDVVIIAQTAYGLTGDKEKAIQAGCDDYIAKPIDKSELITLMQKYFGE